MRGAQKWRTDSPLRCAERHLIAWRLRRQVVQLATRDHVACESAWNDPNEFGVHGHGETEAPDRHQNLKRLIKLDRNRRPFGKRRAAKECEIDPIGKLPGTIS